jgi:hypothetical protein
MTGKSDFTEQEWELVSQAPTSAGMAVITASRGGTFRETFSMAKAYGEAREQHGEGELLDELVSAKPNIERARGSVEELRMHSMQKIRDAIALVEQKATPEELGQYRQFIRSLAERVANAHREHGEQVSDAERATLDEIDMALGDGA